MRGLLHLITAAASLQGSPASSSSSNSISSPAMTRGDDVLSRSLNEATVSGDENPKGGGFLASADLFGEPRQFLDDDSRKADDAQPKQALDNNNDDFAEANMETEGTTITIIAEEDTGDETGDSSSSNIGSELNPAKRNSSSTGIMMDLYEPCPPGFICSTSGQESCESVRQIPISLGMGDIHAGLYCP